MSKQPAPMGKLITAFPNAPDPVRVRARARRIKALVCAGVVAALLGLTMLVRSGEQPEPKKHPYFSHRYTNEYHAGKEGN